MHDHAHSHGHAHPTGAGIGNEARRGQAKRLLVVIVLNLAYMIAEVVGGLLTGSLALLADAGHTLSDLASLGLGLFAVWFAQRPASASRTYGHTRVEILAALAEGIALVGVGLVIFYEAFERLGVAHEVNGLAVMWIAAGALVANGLGALILNAGRRESLNIQGVWLHLATDALGSLGVVAAGAAVWLFGWVWADTAVSMVIGVMVLLAAWQLLRSAVDILMEAAPGHLDVEEIRSALGELGDVTSVHDLHVWTIGNGEVSLSSHLVAPPDRDPNALLREVRRLLDSRFSIRHSTIQIELEDDAEADCEGACDPPVIPGSAVVP